MTFRLIGKGGPLLPFDRDVRPDAVGADPSTAKLQMMLAEFQHDHGLMSGRELAKIEQTIGGHAKKAITLFNPYTRQYRKVHL